MLRKRPAAVHPLDRRPALWPYILMPLIALALYLALESVRHATEDAPGTQGPPGIAAGNH